MKGPETNEKQGFRGRDPHHSTGNYIFRRMAGVSSSESLFFLVFIAFLCSVIFRFLNKIVESIG